MRTRHTVLAFAIALGLCVLAPSLASAQPLDFSDAKEQLFTWPFDVIEYSVEDDGMNIFQHTRVQESATDIYDALKSMKDDGGEISGFLIVGATKQADGSFVFTLARDNLKYLVVVTSDGAGAKLSVKSTPNAMQTGFYKRALYGYRLGDNKTVGCHRYNHGDE